MYPPSSLAANAYARVDLESGVMGASPHQLIILLYEGAELAVRMAIRHIQDGELMKKADAISKADCILREGLRAALDSQRGGQLAHQLDALYDYMGKRILLGHLRNDPAPLLEVLGLLRELREAWQQIGAPARASSPSLSHPIAA